MTRPPALHMAFFALIGCLAVAFAALGAGHAPPRMSDPAYEAYLLAGGTVDDLCADDFHGAVAHDCPVCHLTGKSTLPPLPMVAEWSGGRAVVLSVPHVTPVREAAIVQPYAARGPPVLI